MVSYLLVERVCDLDANRSLRCAHAKVKNAPESAGYVTSGFWVGITIGRLVWGHCTPKYVPSPLSFADLVFMIVRLSYTQRKWVIEGCL